MLIRNLPDLPDDLLNFNQGHLMNDFVNMVRQKEEDLIKQLIFQITGREATIEDAKKLTKFYYPGEPLNYDLAYEGSRIGYVRFDMNGPNYTITFTPDKRFKE
jgi:hypothetical protein